MPTLVNQLRTWYASPTGAMAGAGFVLAAVGIAADGAWRWLGVIGLVVLAITIPRRFVRDRADAHARTDDATAAAHERMDHLQVAVDQVAGDADKRLTNQSERIRTNRRRSDTAAETLKARLDKLRSDTSVEAAGLTERVAATTARLDRMTGTASEIHNRDLDPLEIGELIDYWAPRLDLDIAADHLQAALHRIRSYEALATGRIATNVEDVLIRCMAARAVAQPITDLCEIGTLFGIGGLVVRDSIAPFSDTARITIIDPLAGYYGPDRADPPTGLPVNRRILDRNIELLAPGDGNVRVIEGYSTDDAVRAEASDRRYQLLIIDGDHSYDGVRLDFERYADLVSDGGILIVDDYGAKAWPEVTQFTDDVVMVDPRFSLIGAGSRTALFRRI